MTKELWEILADMHRGQPEYERLFPEDSEE